MICPKCGRKIKGNYCSECRIYLVSGERTEEIRRAEPKQRESGWRDGALAGSRVRRVPESLAGIPAGIGNTAVR